MDTEPPDKLPAVEANHVAIPFRVVDVLAAAKWAVDLVKAQPTP
jgi:hypothetical protein